MVFGIPIPWVCFQIGTTDNPCRCKVVGPTLGEIRSLAWFSGHYSEDVLTDGQLFFVQ